MTRAVSFPGAVLFANALVPLGMMSYDASTGSLGADPINFVTRATGTLTLFFLVLTLAVTPTRRLLGWNALAPHRRTLGLFAFFYGALHFLTYLWFDAFFDVMQLAADVLGRPFITVGLAAFLLMVPLAFTSTSNAIRRMGGARWRRLHRYAYVIAALGVVHYWLLVKADVWKPLLFGIAVGVLLVFRIVDAWRKRFGAAARAQDAP